MSNQLVETHNEITLVELHSEHEMKQCGREAEATWRPLDYINRWRVSVQRMRKLHRVIDEQRQSFVYVSENKVVSSLDTIGG